MKTMKKSIALKSISLAAVMALSSFAFTGCGDSETSSSSASSADETVTIRLADMPIWSVVTFSYAKESGILEEYFADYNVEFEISTFESGPAENEAFASDNIDFAIMGNMPAVTGVTNDYGDKIIGVAYTSDHVGSVVVPVNSQITSLEELEGKTIGTVIGGGYHYYIGVYLDSIGLTLDDVNLINTGSETATSIRNEEIDAGIIDAAVAQQLVTEGSAKVIYDQYQEEPMGVICASEKFTEKYPELTEVMLKAIQATNEKVDADREAFFNYLEELTGSDTTSVEETWDLRKYQAKDFTETELDSMASLLEWMQENNLITNTEFKADDLYNLTYIKEAGLN